MTEPRKLRVFLCHASQDKPIVRELYQRLSAEGWIDPWLDEEKLLPGQDWDMEIEKAAEASDAVIIFISSRSVVKEGYVQKELRRVLDIALEKPEGTIFVIPLRLDECDLPRRLRSWHFVDYFPEEQSERAYGRLLEALKLRMPESGSRQAGVKKNKYKPAAQPKKSVQVTDPDKNAVPLNSELMWIVPLLIYFLLTSMDVFLPSSDVVENTMGVFAIFAGFLIIIKRQIPVGIPFKLSLMIFLLLYGLGYRVIDSFPFVEYIVGSAALATGVLWVASFNSTRKTLLFLPILFALFLLLVGIYEIATNIAYSDFTTMVDTFVMITGVATSILLWLDI
jgi:hypothetical protein